MTKQTRPRGEKNDTRNVERMMKRLRPLVITDETRQRIASVLEFARMKPLSYREAVDLLEGRWALDPRRLCKVDWGYKCWLQVISMPDNSEAYQLTIQTEARGVVPGSVVVETLMYLFGLGALPADLVYGEEAEDGGVLHILRIFRPQIADIELDEAAG